MVLLQKANNCAYNPYTNPTLHIKIAFNFISLKSIITRHGTNVKWGVGKWFTLVNTCARLISYTKSYKYMYIMHWFRKTDTKRAHIQKSIQNSRYYVCHHCLCQWAASSAFKMDGSEVFTTFVDTGRLIMYPPQYVRLILYKVQFKTHLFAHIWRALQMHFWIYSMIDKYIHGSVYAFQNITQSADYVCNIYIFSCKW